MRSELYHYGVKGMKWGVRKRLERHRTNRQARKDAKEFARAKMYYGEGAGNRRKLIRAKVNERSKNPEYKKEFDKYYAEQDMSKHADASVRERHTRDAINATARTARGIYHQAMGDMAKVSATAAIIYTVARMTGADKKVKEWGKQKFEDFAYRYADAGRRYAKTVRWHV